MVNGNFQEEDNIKEELEALGIRRSKNIFINPWLTALMILALGLGLTVFLGRLYKLDDYTQLASMILAGGAFLVGLQQWKLSRAELAFDKFYERLDIVNNRLDQWPAARNMVKQFWGEADIDEEYQKRMYVYVEIDNLEYATQKYKMRFMVLDDVYREVTLFESRCVSEEFRCYASSQVDVAGYRQDTREIVHRIIAKKKSE